MLRRLRLWWLDRQIAQTSADMGLHAKAAALAFVRDDRFAWARFYGDEHEARLRLARLNERRARLAGRTG